MTPSHLTHKQHRFIEEMMETARVEMSATAYEPENDKEPTCKGRTYGPPIKSLTEDLSQNTLQEEASAKSEDL